LYRSSYAIKRYATSLRPRFLKEGFGKGKVGFAGFPAGRGLSRLKWATGCDLEGDFLTFTWLLLRGDALQHDRNDIVKHLDEAKQLQDQADGVAKPNANHADDAQARKGGKREIKQTYAANATSLPAGFSVDRMPTCRYDDLDKESAFGRRNFQVEGRDERESECDRSGAFKAFCG
jgi:hypothetical protein